MNKWHLNIITQVISAILIVWNGDIYLKNIGVPCVIYSSNIINRLCCSDKLREKIILCRKCKVPYRYIITIRYVEPLHLVVPYDKGSPCETKLISYYTPKHLTIIELLKSDLRKHLLPRLVLLNRIFPSDISKYILDFDRTIIDMPKFNSEYDVKPFLNNNEVVWFTPRVYVSNSFIDHIKNKFIDLIRYVSMFE